MSNVFSVSPWPEGKDAACIFMIDDLANIHFVNDRSQPAVGQDWGALNVAPNGLWDFLSKKILSIFNDVKFTFFLVTDEREIQVSGSYPYCQSCCSDIEFINFLKFLERQGHEVAYHGTKHGQIINKKFIQEWQTFENLKKGINVIENGKELFSRSLDRNPIGGKYCGYVSGDFGHLSLQNTGFKWWFDSWDADVSNRPRGQWVDDILYLPSNIDCSNYHYSCFDKVTTKKYWASQFNSMCHGTLKRKIKRIVENKGVISLQEHTSPYRTDGKTQYPNVIDDINNVNYILNLLLNDYDIWFTTASKVYLYLNACKNIDLICFGDFYELHVSNMIDPEVGSIWLESDYFKGGIMVDEIFYNPSMVKGGVCYYEIILENHRRFFSFSESVLRIRNSL